MSGRLVLLFLLLFPPAALAEGSLSVRARLLLEEPPKNLTIGTPIYVEVEARHPPGGVALLPERLELPEALAERRRARAHARRVEEDEEVDVYQLEIIPFKAGLIELPPLPVALGSTVSKTEPLLFEVTSTLDETELAIASSTQPETIQALERMAAVDPPPEGVSVPDFRPALVLLGLVAAVVLVLLARKLLRPGHRQKPPPPPPRPAHEVALERLDALAASQVGERGEHEAFFTELSHILRGYLGGRYGFDALELTLDEIQAALEARLTPGLDRSGTRTLLEEADQVKFAKYRPRPEDIEAALRKAKDVVERTRYDNPLKDPAAEKTRPGFEGPEASP